jgi:hypothetical protein
MNWVLNAPTLRGESWIRIAGTLLEGQFTVLMISNSVLLGMRNVSDKSCRNNQNTHFV